MKLPAASGRGIEKIIIIKTEIQNPKLVEIVKYRFKDWIPAFAGMTII